MLVHPSADKDSPIWPLFFVNHSLFATQAGQCEHNHYFVPPKGSLTFFSLFEYSLKETNLEGHYNVWLLSYPYVNKTFKEILQFRTTTGIDKMFQLFEDSKNYNVFSQQIIRQKKTQTKKHVESGAPQPRVGIYVQTTTILAYKQ